MKRLIYFCAILFSFHNQLHSATALRSLETVEGAAEVFEVSKKSIEAFKVGIKTKKIAAVATRSLEAVEEVAEVFEASKKVVEVLEVGFKAKKAIGAATGVKTAAGIKTTAAATTAKVGFLAKMTAAANSVVTTVTSIITSPIVLSAAAATAVVGAELSLQQKVRQWGERARAEAEAQAQTQTTQATTTALEKTALPKHTATAPFEKKDDDDEDTKHLNYRIMAALIKSKKRPKLDNNGTLFDLPGQKTLLSQIPTVKGKAVQAGKHLIVSDVDIPGFGKGNLVLELQQVPVQIAAHTTAREPMIYGPSSNGQLLRVPKVPLPGGGKGDLVLFIPDALLDLATNKKRLGVSVGAKAALTKAGQKILQAASGDDADKIKSIGEGNINPGNVAGVLAVSAGAAGGVVLSTSGAGITVVFGTGGLVIPVVIVGGAAAYGIVKGVELIKHKVHAKRERKRLEQEALKQGGCGAPVTTPERPAGPCIGPKIEPSLTTGCGNTQPINVATTTGCGNAQPPQDKNKPGCGSITPVVTASDLVLNKLKEEEVKNKIGKILDGLNVETPQNKLDHVTEGHVEGGKKVYENPEKPKTLFDKEEQIPNLLVKTLESGQKTTQGQATKYEYDFGVAIGRTITGEPLTKARVIIMYDQATGKNILVSMYPFK